MNIQKTDYLSEYFKDKNAEAIGKFDRTFSFDNVQGYKHKDIFIWYIPKNNLNKVSLLYAETIQGEIHEGIFPESFEELKDILDRILKEV